MSYYNTVQTTYGYQNWIAHACSVIILRRLTGPFAFFLFTRDYTLWLVSKYTCFKGTFNDYTDQTTVSGQ